MVASSDFYERENRQCYYNAKQHTFAITN